MANEIQIRAKKISQIENVNFPIYENGDKMYLLISYKPNNNENGQNFKLSVEQMIEEINENINIPGDTIADKIINYISENTVNSTTFVNSLKQHLGNESAWEAAQRLGKTGGAQTEESWYDLILSGIGSNIISVNNVSISGSTEPLIVGNTRNLTAVINPSNATNKNVVWASNNNNIATVNNGIVTAISAGQVIITVQTEDGNYSNSISLTIKPLDLHNYIFSYASEEQSEIFIKTNGIITGINITAVKSLFWTQEYVGKVPTSNKNGHGFYLKDYNTTQTESFIWDETVSTGKVWIILPSKFYNIEQNYFIDENDNKWKYIDPLFKNTQNPVLDPITITNLYEGQNYVLLCFSEEGQVDEQYFIKV